MESAAGQGPGAAFWRVEAGAEALEIGCGAGVEIDGEKAGRRYMQGVLGLALDGLGQLFRRDLAEREIHSGEMLAIEGVEFRIVGGAVLRTEPPAPVAAFRDQERLVSFFQGGFLR